MKQNQKIKTPIMDNKAGFVSAGDKNLYDGEGNILHLHGVNLGNWFDQEHWMAVSSAGCFETGVYTQLRGAKAMQANPNLTEEQINELDKLYLDTYIKESDFAVISSLGLNCVRINFTYFNFTTDGEALRENAFYKLDWALDMCEKYGLYAILDLHGAIGSQNKDFHSGNDAEFNLYKSAKNRALTVKLWETLAGRYKDRKIVAGYDLLNEPRSAPHRYSGKKQFDFYNELYLAIRKIDANHMIIMECFTFPTHGVNPKKYGWENVCYSYHIYNLTPFSQKTCLKFYRALHKFKRYKVPVFIGEWNCWGSIKNWEISMDFFDREGWSYCSWTYKTNKHIYKKRKNKMSRNWGIFELDMVPVDLSSAGYDEIHRVWGSVATENAEKTPVYDVYKARFAN